MLLTNVFQMRNFPNGSVKVRRVKFSGLPVDEKRERISYLQSIISTLNEKGLDATLTPRNEDGDLSILNPGSSDTDLVQSMYSDFSPQFLPVREASMYELEEAWKNRVRTHFSETGFQKVGKKYVKVSDILSSESDFKEAYDVQAEFINGQPAISVDPRVRIMEELAEEDIRQAGDPDTRVDVQILPKWKGGELTGKAGFKAGEKSFPYHGEELPTPEYWKRKYGIDYVDEDDEMLNVYVSSFDRELPYPASTVFSSFSRGRSLPDDLKKDPKQRVSEAAQAIDQYFEGMSFVGRGAELSKLTTADELGYSTFDFEESGEFDVKVGGGRSVDVEGIHGGLKSSGPYAGEIDGEYVVIAPEGGKEVRDGFERLAEIYSDELNLGSIEPCTSVGNNGIIEVGSSNSNAYANRITEVRAELDEVDSDLIAFVVLPGENQEVYFQARGKLFEHLFGNSPVPAQAIQYKNVVKLANRNREYWMGVNTASQVYVKLGKIGSALWVLDTPADAHIPGVDPGSSCYAYHDVSRRPDKKSAATAYSATTDAFGRYIATGAKPVGGEKLTPGVFHDILNELLRKVSAFHRKQEAQGEEEFHFQRLVFAKDGKIGWREQEMMKDVLRNGVPDQDKRPLEEIIEGDQLLPDDLVIDVVAVNKSPNKRVVAASSSSFENVTAGTGMIYGDNSGLLVSHKPDQGTAQPMEITAKDHVSLNRDEADKPSAEDLLREYYNLTNLNWSSIFNQGKYALPQILTQNLGENLSAGIEVPDDMAVI